MLLVLLLELGLRLFETELLYKVVRMERRSKEGTYSTPVGSSTLKIFPELTDILVGLDVSLVLVYCSPILDSLYESEHRGDVISEELMN